METLDAIRERHSSRDFDTRPIDRATLERIVDAARLAPTARNDQPWGFVVVTDRSALAEIAAMTDHGKFLAGAAAGVAVFCREGTYYLEDGCCAANQIILAATDLGVQSCWIAADKKAYCPRCRDLLGVPQDHRLVALVALGHERARPERKPKRALADVIHWEKW